MPSGVGWESVALGVLVAASSHPTSDGTIGSMDQDQDPALPLELERLADEIRVRVDSQRASGELPPALEAELDQFLRAFAVRPDDNPTERARTAALHATGLPALAPGVGRSSAGVDRRRPDGFTARLLQRQSSGLLGQVQAWRESLETAVVALIEALDRLDAGGLPTARDALLMILDRLPALEVLERSVADLESRVSDLEERAVGRL